MLFHRVIPLRFQRQFRGGAKPLRKFLIIFWGKLWGLGGEASQKNFHDFRVNFGGRTGKFMSFSRRMYIFPNLLYAGLTCIIGKYSTWVMVTVVFMYVLQWRKTTLSPEFLWIIPSGIVSTFKNSNFVNILYKRKNLYGDGDEVKKI